jgi:ribonuclease HII
MNLYTELKLFRLGFTTVAGVDEVGIGALAGPVIATCVIFDGKSLMANRLWHKEVRDS